MFGLQTYYLSYTLIWGNFLKMKKTQYIWATFFGQLHHFQLKVHILINFCPFY